MESLLHFLPPKFGKEELDGCLGRIEEFESFKSNSDISITEFMTIYDRKCQYLARGNMTIPSPILPFRMLKKANISADDEKHMLSRMDYANKDTLQANKPLPKSKGEQYDGSGSTSSNCNGPSEVIKVEPAYCTRSKQIWPNLVVNRTQYSSCHVDLSTSRIYFGSLSVVIRRFIL